MRNRPAPQNAPPPPQAPRAGGPEEIPCRSANRAAWKYAALALAFAAWLAFLIYCAAAGK